MIQKRRRYVDTAAVMFLKNFCETEEKSLKIWGATVKETFHLALVGGDW